MPIPPVNPAALARPPHADHSATPNLRAAQAPLAGQLWRSSAGQLWRVITIDLARRDERCAHLELAQSNSGTEAHIWTDLAWFQRATFVRATSRAGDHIHHAPTGEDWLLAADERDGRVICCGWPESLGNASDCTLVRGVSDEDHLKVLRAVAKHDGLRGSWARRDLAALTSGERR
jgi:hypothetical protein